MSQTGRAASVAEHIRRAGERLGDRLEAELLASLALEQPRRWLYAHAESVPDPITLNRYEALVQQRLDGIPIAYLSGRREFYGREFRVDSRVLIPRPETEHLVDTALQLELPEDADIADIGTGSGCIVLTLASERPGWHCIGCDISPDALEVAESNRAALDLNNVELRHGDLVAPLGQQQCDLIVANLPYVAEHDPHLKQGDLRHEPEIALTPGGDGLVLLHQLVAQAPARLKPGGWLVVEHGYDQAEPVRARFAAAELQRIDSIRDLGGIERIALGQKCHGRADQ